MATPSDSFFLRQEAELQKYSNKRVREVLMHIEFARLEIKNRISDLSEISRQNLIELNNQLDTIARNLRIQIGQVGSSSEDLSRLVAGHLQQTIPEIGGPAITLSFNTLNTDVLMQFSRNELNKVTSIVADQEIQTLRAILFSRVGVQGQSPQSVAKELAGSQGVFTKRYGIVQNILRTEASTVYNEQALLGIEEANAKYDLKLNKKIIETIDNKRNHPISQILNGQVVATLDKKGNRGQFKAKVSAVENKAKQLGKSARGVFWRESNGYYVGDRLPAHYMERGIVVPTDEEPTIR